MANAVLDWVFHNVMPWVMLGMLCAAAGMLVLLIAAGVDAFRHRNDGPEPIVLDVSEWDCAEWHEEEEYVAPLIIGGAIYPQPSRKVTVADVYVRRGYRGRKRA